MTKKPKLTLPLKVGDRKTDGLGRTIELLRSDNPLANYPFLGLCKDVNSGGYSLERYTKVGAFYVVTANARDLQDLPKPKKKKGRKRVGFVNVYGKGNCITLIGPYTTEEGALRSRGAATQDTIKIKWRERETAKREKLNCFECGRTGDTDINGVSYECSHCRDTGIITTKMAQHKCPDCRVEGK